MRDEMTVEELMGLLEEEPEHAVVRILHQRQWPLQEVVGGIASSTELFDDEPNELGQEDSEGREIIYMVANGHPQFETPYGSERAWNVMRRGR